MADVTQHKAKMVAAGCPADQCDKLAASCSDDECAKLAALPVGAIDWSHLLSLIAQYGPTIVGWLLFFLGKGPMPVTPFPILKT